MSNRLERSIKVETNIEQTFDLFVSRLDDWWPKSHRPAPTSRLSLEPHVGGRFFALTDSGEEKLMGEVLACNPPNLLIYTWYPGAVDKPTHVEVRFMAQEDGTLVEVTHSEGDSGLADKWEERVKLFINAWGTVLPAFAEFSNLKSNAT